MFTRKKLAFWLGYALFIVIFIVSIDYLFYRWHRLRILPPHLSNEELPELLRRVGWICINKQSHYTRFKEEKKEGVVRIGCFGDSFTYGDEVNDIYDYPNLLQDIFRKKGYQNVEVINFGISAYGFHQAYMLWDFVGKKYNLDYIVLGPGQFHQYDRDSSFTGDGDEYVGPSHARYILKGNDVELVEVIGDTPLKRTMCYTSFFTPLRYILFDRKAPLFLSASLDCLWPGRNLRNPFYYKSNIEKEMQDIYKILFSKMADAMPQVIVGIHDEGMVKFVREINKGNLFSFQVLVPGGFLYNAFTEHHSPQGNQLVAEQIFDCITNKTESEVSIIEAENIEAETIRNVRMPKKDLSAYKDIAIEIEGTKVSRFYEFDLRSETWMTYCDGPSCEPRKNTFSKTKSLLAIRDDATNNITHAVFLPLDFELSEEMPLVASVQGSSGIEEYPLGTVTLLNTDLNIGILNAKKVYFNESSFPHELIVQFDLSKSNIPLKRGNVISIVLKGVPIFYAKVTVTTEKPEFHTLSGRYVIIRGDGREHLDTQKLASEGVIYISLTNQQGECFRVPFAKWVKKKRIVPFSGRRITFPIGCGG